MQKMLILLFLLDQNVSGIIWDTMGKYHDSKLSQELMVKHEYEEDYIKLFQQIVFWKRDLWPRFVFGISEFSNKLRGGNLLVSDFSFSLCDDKIDFVGKVEIYK